VKRLALTFLLPFLLVACSRAPSESSPTPPVVGPLAARIRLCKDLIASSGIIWRPVEALGGPADARPLEGWAAGFDEDAQLLEQAGSTAAASQVLAFADAVSKLAEDVRRPAPADREAARSWDQRTALRRRQLLEAISSEVTPLLPMCSRQIHRR